jgi:hypothetical protein
MSIYLKTHTGHTSNAFSSMKLFNMMVISMIKPKFPLIIEFASKQTLKHSKNATKVNAIFVTIIRDLR